MKREKTCPAAPGFPADADGDDVEEEEEEEEEEEDRVDEDVDVEWEGVTEVDEEWEELAREGLVEGDEVTEGEDVDWVLLAPVAPVPVDGRLEVVEADDEEGGGWVGGGVGPGVGRGNRAQLLSTWCQMQGEDQFVWTKIRKCKIRKHEDMRGYARICENMREYARICENMREYARICENMREYTRIYEDMRGCARICENVRKEMVPSPLLASHPSLSLPLPSLFIMDTVSQLAVSGVTPLVRVVIAIVGKF
jgi:hypothetical protein